MLTQAVRDGTHCFAAHRALVELAAALAGAMALDVPHESDLLRLGAGCVNIASHQALANHDPRSALRAWNQCEPGERQIRAATYRLMALSYIEVERYDSIFRAASHAMRARRDEQLRLRRVLHELCLI